MRRIHSRFAGMGANVETHLIGQANKNGSFLPESQLQHLTLDAAVKLVTICGIIREMNTHQRDKNISRDNKPNCIKPIL